MSNALFLKAEAEGLATQDGRDFFLMACWLAMAAAEAGSVPRVGKLCGQFPMRGICGLLLRPIFPDVSVSPRSVTCCAP